LVRKVSPAHEIPWGGKKPLHINASRKWVANEAFELYSLGLSNLHSLSKPEIRNLLERAKALDARKKNNIKQKDSYYARLKDAIRAGYQE